MIRRPHLSVFFFFNDTATTEIYTLSLHDALPILHHVAIAAPTLLDPGVRRRGTDGAVRRPSYGGPGRPRAPRRRPGPPPFPPALSRPPGPRPGFLPVWPTDPPPFCPGAIGGPLSAAQPR